MSNRTGPTPAADLLALLAFAPHFCLPHLPYPSREHAYQALQVSHKAGLTNVRLGNRHLLGWGRG
ncbi:MAG: hypothetical protein JSV61_04745 [Anaerolineales bacterium]|nr:MAG: hypothetical protein JSV61_04745 [Anaerolineales bacterium]